MKIAHNFGRMALFAILAGFIAVLMISTPAQTSTLENTPQTTHKVINL